MSQRVRYDEFHIAPTKTTISLHRGILEHPQFIDATFDIRYVERILKADVVEGEAVQEPARR